MKLKMVTSWALVVCLPVLMLAQSPSTRSTAQATKLMGEDHALDVKRQIERRGVGERAKVTLRDKTELKGYISRIDSESFELTENKTGRVTTIAFQDVARVRKPGMPVAAKAAIIGVTVAVSLVVVAATLPKD